jgi:hypothetical protein
MTPEFETFNKIARLSRECTVTEKIDGTNGQILVTEDGHLWAGSRNRWLLTPEGLLEDNHGFGRWALEHIGELISGLGIGRHYGEWWGQGIQRRYNMTEKRFSLFNTHVWTDGHNRSLAPACCYVVPVLYKGLFDQIIIQDCLNSLRETGSVASPGFMKPEGVVVWHDAAKVYFKKTIEGDEKPKGQVTE